MTTRAPIILAAGEGDKQSFMGGGLHTWKLSAEQTDGHFFLLEDVMVKGKCTPLHCHPEADELSYVLEGEIIVNHDGKETRIGAGGMAFVPKGVPHAFLVVSESARILALHSPATSSQAFYRGASDPATSEEAATVDIPRLQASAKANPRGIELLGPPPFQAPKLD
jgi:quercetin dioxygenase-like cupin family protein